MIAAMDDSGDCGLDLDGGSSHFLAYTVTIFVDPKQASECQDRISQLRKDLQLKEAFEFKFTKCTHAQRVLFFEAVLPLEFRYAARLIDKTTLVGNKAWAKKEFFYQRMMDLVLDAIRPHLVEAKVLIDECGGKAFDRELARYLRRHAGESEGKRRIKETKTLSSRKHLLLQMADMICGAVARSFYEDKRESAGYRQLIRAKEISVELWPPK